jgi:hypothetical protein
MADNPKTGAAQAVSGSVKPAADRTGQTARRLEAQAQGARRASRCHDATPALCPNDNTHPGHDVGTRETGRRRHARGPDLRSARRLSANSWWLPAMTHAVS